MAEVLLKGQPDDSAGIYFHDIELLPGVYHSPLPGDISSLTLHGTYVRPAINGQTLIRTVKPFMGRSGSILTKSIGDLHICQHC